MNGGDGKSLPGMLDKALKKLGIRLENRHEEPSVSVEVTFEPVGENTRYNNGIRI